MSRPIFTLVVPTFNRAHFLKDVVPHLLQQSCEDYELIIADNASTDDTPSVMKGFDDPRIRCIRREENLGPAGNLNACLEEARGRYFVLNQDDDLIHVRFLERARETMDACPESVFFAGVAWLAGDGVAKTSPLVTPIAEEDRFFMTKDQPIEIDGATAAAKALLRLPFVFPAVAIRTEALRRIGGFFDGPSYGADVVTLVRLALLGKCSFDPRVGAYYRYHGDNVSRKQSKPDRIAAHRISREQCVKAMEEAGGDWQGAVARELRAMDPTRVLHEFKQLAECGAPRELRSLVYEALVEAWPKSGLRRVTKLITRVGVGNLVKHFASRD